MSEKQWFHAEPGTVLRTHVDPMGLITRVRFGKHGEYGTTDPGILEILNTLANDPNSPIKRGKSRRKAATAKTEESAPASEPEVTPEPIEEPS